MGTAMGLSADDIAGMRAAVAATLPELVEVYDTAAAVLQWSGPGWLSNQRSLTSRRDANDFHLLHLPRGAAISPGSVVRHRPVEAELATEAWFLVAKLRRDTATTLREEAMVLPLPYLVTVTRPSTWQTAAPRSPWGSPPDPSSAPGLNATQITVRLGLSNAIRPVDEGQEGRLPKTATTTGYVPLGAVVLLGDRLTLPEGLPARVAEAGFLYANGIAYARRLQLALSAGVGVGQ